MKNKNTIFLTKHYLLQKNKIILFTVLSISISIFNLFIPLVVSEFVNTMLAEKIFNFTYSQLIYLSLIILLYLLFQFLKSYLDTNIIATSNKILRKKLISKLYRLDLNKNKNSYNINQIINSDVPIVQTFYNKVFINIIKDILTIIGIIIIILLFSIKLFIFFIIVSGVYYMMYRIIGNKIYNLNKEMIHQRDLLSNRIEFLNNNILSAKCFYENSSNDKSIKKRISLISKILNKNGLFSALSIVMNSSIYYIVIIVLFAYGGYEVSRGNLTIGAVFSIFLYLNMALNPTKNLSNLFVMLKSNMTNIERVREFFELIEEDTERNLSNKRLPEISNGKVLLKDCEVYLQNRFNSGLNFTFERGRLNKINGYNGIGKTRLLLSILKLNSSTNIFIDGNEISYFDSKYLRSKVGISFQEPQFTGQTIMENITDSQNIGMQSKINSLAIKYIDMYTKNVIENIFQDKLHLSELSMGQKQILSFVSAINKYPEILILDETLSNLDDKNRVLIFDLLVNLSPYITCIYVEHQDSFSNKEVKEFNITNMNYNGPKNLDTKKGDVKVGI